jgi:hypothetical protein
MMFDVDDWIERLVKAEGRIEIDSVTMRVPKGDVLSPECKAIWAEIQPNEEKWRPVYDEVLRRLGGVGGGFAIYPDDVRGG